MSYLKSLLNKGSGHLFTNTMVLDTLVYTVSFLLIPINIAATRSKYILMNTFIALLATSWSTHSIWHVKDKPCTTIYCSLDEFTCNATIITSFIHGVMYSRFIYFFMYCVSLSSVAYFYFKLRGNPNYHKRGLKNWHHHKYHMLMHASAVVGLSMVSL
jgi:hypothetical protein